MSQHQNNNGPVVAPRDEAALQEILRRRLCFLSGGRDRQGGAILTIPATSCAWERLKADELLETFRYLIQIPSEDVQRHGFTIIIDMRSSTWNNTKALLRSIQDSFPGSVRAVYVVKPDDFHHRPKPGPGGQPKYGFEMSLISVDQLPKYINLNQLTEDLGGTIHYKHEEWIYLRKTIEMFLGQAVEMLDRLEAWRKSLANAELPSTFDGAEAMTKQHHELKKQLARCPVEPMEDDGTKILLRFDPKLVGQYEEAVYSVGAANGAGNHNGTRLTQNPDIQAALIRVKQQVDRLHICRVQLDQAWTLRLERLQHCKQLRSFEQQAEQVLLCLSENCQQLLKSYSDVGISLLYVKELEKQHEQFQIGCMDLFLHIDRALDFGSKLSESGNYALQIVKQVVERLKHERESFSLGLKDRTAVLSLSSSFHRKAEEFMNNFSIWNAACDPEDGQVENNAQIEAMLEQNRFVEKSLDQSKAEVETCYSRLWEKLHRPPQFITIKSSSAFTPDFARASAHVSNVWKKVQNQYGHLTQRSTIKKRTLDKQYALRLFNEDVKQVIDWIEKWGDPFLKKTCEIGKTLVSARKLQERQDEFESVAESTYKNAEKLMDSAEKLIEKGGCNVEEFQVSSRQLSRQTEEFRARVAARKVLLETACTFYERLSSLASLLERAKRSLSVESNTESLESVVEGLNRLHQERQAVTDCCAHVEHEGSSLLAQLSNSSMKNTTDYNHVKDMLRTISDNLGDLEEFWEPRRLKLEVLCKLRTFERSAEQIVKEIDIWSAQVEERISQHLNANLASQELESLDQTISDFDTNIQQAFNRGGELLQFLESSSKIAELFDVTALCDQITDVNEELTMRQENLAEDIEVYRMHLQNITRLHECEVRAQQVLLYIQSCHRTLQSLPLSFLSVERCDDVLKRYVMIEKEIRRLHTAVQEAQRYAEDIEHNDIDGAAVAGPLKDTLVTHWENLQAYSTELVRTIKSGRSFFEFAEQVLNVLTNLRKEYDEDQDWCTLKKSSGLDAALESVMELLQRHHVQKETFMKLCNTVRKNSETFQRGLGRLVNRSNNSEPSRSQIEAAVKNTVRAVLENIRQQESTVMQRWTTRRPSFDHCKNYLMVEKSARQALAWIQDAGERYLFTHEPVNNPNASPEMLLAEHRMFLERAEENKEKIKLLISLADSMVRNGQDCHVDRIKYWVSQVETRQKDFMDRMRVYKHNLGERVNNSGSSKQVDRNSSGSLEEGKLQEYVVNGTPKTEEEKKLTQRKHIMKELLDTEQTYVNDLRECIVCFVRNEKHSHVTPPQDLLPRLPVIFGNIEQIYDFHSKVFLKELQKYEQVPEDVAHCFLAWAREFDMYVDYCKNKPAATDRMVEPIAIEYFEKLKECYGLPANNTIASYLIKPVQRITKYSLLLKELVKTCADERKEIQEALDMMRDVPRKANDAINLGRLEGYSEPLEHLGDLIATDFFQVSEPTRVLTKQHPRQVFLFELAVLFAKRIGDGLKDPKFAYRFKLPTAGLVLTKSMDKDPDLSFIIGLGRPPQFYQSSSESKYLLRAASKDIKEAWIAKLEDVKSSANSSVVDTVSIRTKSSRTAPDSSRTSRDFDDGQSVEEDVSSRERYSIISQSSSNTTDSDKVLHEGEWATVTDNYEAIHDGELTVQKGECVEILDRLSSSKQDVYLVRIKSGAAPRHRASLVPSTQSSNTAASASSSGKVLEGYLPGTVLSLVPAHRSGGLPSPSTNSMEASQPPAADGLSGSASTITLPVPQSASADDGSLGDTTLSTTSVPPPNKTKRRGTLKKWLPSLSRKNSGGIAPVASLPKRGLSSSMLLSSNNASASYTPPSSATSSSSRAKNSFQASYAQASQVLVPAVSDDVRRSSAPPLAQVEDIPSDDDPHLYSKACGSISAPVSANVSLDVVANEPISIMPDMSDEHVGVPSVLEMPPPMELTQLKHSISGLNPSDTLPMSFSLASTLPAVAHASYMVDTVSSNQAEFSGPDRDNSSHSLLLSSLLPSTERAILTSHTTDLVSIHANTTELEEAGIENLLVESPSVGGVEMSDRIFDTKGPLSSVSKGNQLSQVPDELQITKAVINGCTETGEQMDSEDPSSKESGRLTDVLTGQTDGEQKNTMESTATEPEPVVAVAVQDPTAKAVIMRDYVLRELVDTERDYVKDLGLIIDGYIAHMHNNPVPDDMNGRDKLIFGNIEQIYVFHRDTFCGELEKCLEAADRLPQAFIRYERKFQMYVVYCQNKPKSEFIVSEYVDSYFEEIRLKLGEKLKLPDMLIKPVQRVMRYQLMLKDIMKYTERAGLGDKSVADLQKALNCIMGICKLANDFMEVGRLQGFEGKLTAQGKLLLQDSFLVCETFTAVAQPGQTPKEKDKKKEEDSSATNNKFKERQIFVFEQVAIFSESLSSSNHKKSTYSSPVYIYKSHIQVNKMSLIEVEKDVVRFALRSRDPHTGDRMFVIEAPSIEKRDIWVAQVKALLDTQQNFLRALQSPIDFQRQQGRQQGEEMTLIPGLVSTALMSTVGPPPVAEVLSTPPHSGLAGRPPHKALHAPPGAETSESKLTMRPKSYVEPDRRRPLSIPRSPESPNSIVRGYAGSITGPITPPLENVVITPLSYSTPQSAAMPGITRKSSGRFLFPVPALKVVHSEADLFKKGGKSAQSAALEPAPGMTPSSSKTSLGTGEQGESKSRRWSISGRRDKSPSGNTPAVLPAVKDRISSLSFRKKN